MVFAKFPDKIESVLALDDSAVWGGIHLMVDATDQLISQFAQRLRDRQLYKAIDVRGEVTKRMDPSGTGEKDAEIDRACVRIWDEICNWNEERGEDIPRVLLDRAERSPYKSGDKSGGPLGRINMKTASGDLVDLKERSHVVAALKIFKAFRVYVADDDTEAREFVGRMEAGL